jgi:hypothetical protein
MTGPRVFKLLVPATYGYMPKASGKIGATPDTTLSGISDFCVRSRLPSFIDNLVFKVPTTPSLRGNRQEHLQNLYLLKDFFIVSQTMKEFMLGYFPKEDVEFCGIRFHHSDGTPVAEPYFALKVVRTVECVDPILSTMGYSEPTPFSEVTTVYELDQGLIADFANKDGTHYVSYPRLHNKIKDVYLRESEIPANALLFRPAFWPGYLIIDVKFGNLLE